MMISRFLFFIGFTLIFSTAQAATFTVDDTSDAVDKNQRDGLCLTVSGTCTLRAAIQQANASSGADTITLPNGTYALSLPGANKGVRYGDLNISDDLEISGSAMSSIGEAIIEGSSGWTDRLFNIRPSSLGSHISVTFNNLTLTGGNVTGNGGAIWSQSASLTLSNVSIERNTASTEGGAIYFEGNSASAQLTLDTVRITGNSASFAGGGILFTSGTLSATTCEFSDNTAGLDGGGIRTRLGSYATSVNLTNCTFDGNSAGTHSDGGAVYLSGTTFTATNSTFGRNSAGDDGGAIYYEDTSGALSGTLYNVTIADNTADSDANDHGEGGGIRNNGGIFMIHNTILAENVDSSPTTQAPNCSGAVTALGSASNLTDDSSNCMLLPATGYTLTSDAMLDSFSQWGGSTATYALLSGSPAIDAGEATGCLNSSGAVLSTDQRASYSRTVDGDGDGTARCDIGAYEYTPCDTSSITTYAYLMSFHACDAATTDCTNPENHNVYLAGSNDGDSWTLINEFDSFQGSVADIEFYDGYLYLYTPGVVKKFNACFDSVLSSSVTLSGTDTGGYVDPSLIENSSGELVVFYLPGVLGSDPAGCSSYPCTKEIHSATVSSEDPSLLTQESGNRAEVYLASSGGASDPDIVALNDGTYLLYVSNGGNTLVFTGSSLTDTFVSPDGTSNRVISSGDGGVPSAIQVSSGDIWLYVTTGDYSRGYAVESIRKAVSTDGVTALASSDFSTVLDATVSSSFSSTTSVSSPSVMAWPSGSWSNRQDGD